MLRDMNNPTGPELRQYRRLKPGWITQGDVAKRVGRSRMTIHTWEKHGPPNEIAAHHYIRACDELSDERTPVPAA